MKRSIIILFIIFFLSVHAFAQKYDAEWVIGPNTSVLDFRIDTVGLDTIAAFMNTTLTNADICDTVGNLLYYTNGIYIADKNGNMLLNGDSLSPCQFTFQEYNDGLAITQAAIFLPKPGDLRYYYLFHFSNDTDNNARPGTIYHSVIDNEGNSGLGAVIEKNVPILKDVILREGGMTACKHANGRDYWLIMAGHYTNRFYKFLITPDTILGPFTQNIGPVYNSIYDWGYSKFSQDGSKFVTSCAVGLILIMDFDRCTGEFSNPLTLFNSAGTLNGQPVSGAIAEFSPSGRFVYATNSQDLTQYDLWSGTIQDSTQIWNDSSSDFYKMDMLQMAPNGKIYGSTYNGGLYALHIINNPDLNGDSCDFVYRGQPTLSLNSFNLPNMINYNLGPLAGPCDTITSIQEAENKDIEPRIIPNPADKYVYVEIGMQGNYEFQLLNDVGQLIAKKETKQVDIFDTENLASGIYFLRVVDKNNLDKFLTQKVVVQH